VGAVALFGACAWIFIVGPLEPVRATERDIR